MPFFPTKTDYPSYRSHTVKKGKGEHVTSGTNHPSVPTIFANILDIWKYILEIFSNSINRIEIVNNFKTLLSFKPVIQIEDQYACTKLKINIFYSINVSVFAVR